VPRGRGGLDCQGLGLRVARARGRGLAALGAAGPVLFC
jgi:hypothetical protein